MDLVNLKDDIEKLNKETLPELERILKDILAEITKEIDRLDGMTITIKLKQKEQQ